MKITAQSIQVKTFVILSFLLIINGVASSSSHDHSGTHTYHHQPQTKAQNQQHHQRHYTLKMIESRPHLMQTLSITPITVFFYGSPSTPQYNQFTKTIPAYNDEFHSTTETPIQFVFIPDDKFKLSRPNPSLSIYRKINKGEWLMYRGVFQKTEMFNWIKGNVKDPLKQLKGQEIDEMIVEGKKGFILLDFGQFYLLKAKIMLSQFCTKFELKCGKVTKNNDALGMVIQLMQVDKQPGVPKLGYWDSKSERLEIFTKDVGVLTEKDLMELYSGHESVIPLDAQLDVAQVIHPQTQILQIQQNSQDGLNLDL